MPTTGLLLPQVLHCTEYGARPCWIEQLGQDNEEPFSTRTLSYQAAVGCVEEHARILYQFVSKNFSGTDVTIVYLCRNSLDFALSILAASQVSAYETRRSCRPALLNTRWSSADVVSALQPAASILLIYDQETLADFAMQLCERLQTGNRQVCAMALPLVGCNAATIGTASPHKAMASKTTSAVTTTNTPEEIAKTASVKDALIVFTSGTTSTAKGVLLSHRAILVQAAAKCQPPCEYSGHTQMLGNTVPLFHVGGISSWLAVWLAGGAMVMPASDSRSSNRRNSFSPSIVYRSLAHRTAPVNTLVVVPAMVHALQNEPGHARNSTSIYAHVKLILVGGQALSESQAVFLRTTFPIASIVQTYACTEAASSLTFLDVTKARRGPLQSTTRLAPGVCVGQPPLHVQLQVVSEQTKAPLTKPYQVGILSTRGPHIMNGYWKDPKSVFDEESWYHTSDLMFRDASNYWYFCGRQTDTIRTGGETVWASEVEQILDQHEQIAEVVVLGIPDERLGETVACAVVFRKGVPLVSRPSSQEMAKWCKERGLASLKVPRKWVYLDSLPRNASGKILKHQLKPCFQTLPTSRL